MAKMLTSEIISSLKGEISTLYPFPINVLHPQKVTIYNQACYKVGIFLICNFGMTLNGAFTSNEILFSIDGVKVKGATYSSGTTPCVALLNESDSVVAKLQTIGGTSANYNGQVLNGNMLLITE